MMKRNVYENYPPARRRRSWVASLGWLDVLSLVVLGPFKLLAAVWRIGVRTSFGLVNGLFYGFMGFFGLGLIGMVAFALYRVVLWPLFHHH